MTTKGRPDDRTMTEGGRPDARTIAARRLTPARVRAAWLVAGLAVLVGLAIRVTNLTSDGLWLDELWAATFVQLGFQDLLVAVLRLDVHPPLYYLQLKPWAWLFGMSDAALLANSVFWSTLTVAAVFLATRRVLGPETAALSSCLTAVAGGEVYFAHELRMYALMAFLTVVAWHFCNEYQRKRTLRNGVALTVTIAALANLHGASVVLVSCVLLYLLVRLGFRAALGRGTILIYLCAGLATAPWIVNSSFHEVAHIDAVNLRTIAETIGGWLFGYREDPGAARDVVACILIGGAAVSAFMHRREDGTAARDLVLAFLVWPLVFVFSASLLLRPLWIPRLFAFCTPFAAIAIGAAMVRAWRDVASLLPRAAIAIAACALAGTMAAASLAQGQAGRKMEYREAAAYLVAHVQPGDVVYVPQIRWFWGIARYFVGPDWGNALTVQDPVRPGKSTAWDGLYAWLGHAWLARLNLIPRTREIQDRGVTLVIGWSASDRVQAASRVWLVGSNTIAPDDVAPCRVGMVTPHDFRGVTIDEIACDRTR